jgi:hypothetical protein
MKRSTKSTNDESEEYLQNNLASRRLSGSHRSHTKGTRDRKDSTWKYVDGTKTGTQTYNDWTAQAEEKIEKEPD